MNAKLSGLDLGVTASSRGQVRERIVAAATQLLREHGVDAVTTRAVAERAGLQAPTIYRLFGDKNGLLVAVVHRLFAEYVADKATSVQTDDPVADLRAAWDTHLAFALANPALSTILGATRHGPPTPAAIDGLKVLRGRVERVAVVGRLAVPVSRAVAMIHAAGTGVILVLLATAPEGRDSGLGDAVYEALMRSILADSPAGPDENAVSSAAITLLGNLPTLARFTDAERAMLAEWLARVSDLGRAPEGHG